MKIAILSAVNIKHMSLITLYTEMLMKSHIEFDLIYMDKYNEREEFECNNIYRFVNVVKHSTNKFLKIVQYFKFKKYAEQILKNNKYDFIVVWNDVTIFMFSTYLSKYWKNKYCLNIRDYCGEKHKIIFNRFKKVILNSKFTTISSEGYKNFLPDFEYLTVHSLNKKILSEIPIRTSLRDINKPIRISFIGNIRFFDQNKAIIDLFGNDNRFLLAYYGTNSEILENYSKKRKIRNVDFYGSFEFSKTKVFIEKSDIINNLYGNDNIALTTALSIKLYYGVYLNLPILCSEGTYSSEIIKKHKIGFSVNDIDEHLPDNLYNWYRNLDFNDFKKKTEEFVEEINSNNKYFENIFENIINS